MKNLNYVKSCAFDKLKLRKFENMSIKILEIKAKKKANVVQL